MDKKSLAKLADKKFKDKMKRLGRRQRTYHATDEEEKIVKKSIRKLLKKLRGPV